MKKHMEKLIKLDMPTLMKERATIATDIISTRRGVINGEIQNTQIVKARRRELARVNTLLNMLSNSEPATTTVVTDKVAKVPKTATKPAKKESKK